MSCLSQLIQVLLQRVTSLGHATFISVIGIVFVGVSLQWISSQENWPYEKRFVFNLGHDTIDRLIKNCMYSAQFPWSWEPVGFFADSLALLCSILAGFLGGQLGVDTAIVLAQSSSTRTNYSIWDMRSLMLLVDLLERLCLSSDFGSKPSLKVLMAISSVPSSTSLYTSQYLEE